MEGGVKDRPENWLKTESPSALDPLLTCQFSTLSRRLSTSSSRARIFLALLERPGLAGVGLRAGVSLWLRRLICTLARGGLLPPPPPRPSSPLEPNKGESNCSGFSRSAYIG